MKRKTWSENELLALNQAELHQLRLNAIKQNETSLVQKIEGLGVPFADPAGLKLDSPLGRAMARIVHSEAGKAAAVEATARGRPALEVIDLLFQAELGDEYRNTYEATVQAGYLVALSMRKLGYRDNGHATLSDKCIAKNAILFTKSQA